MTLISRLEQLLSVIIWNGSPFDVFKDNLFRVTNQNQSLLYTYFSLFCLFCNFLYWYFHWTLHAKWRFWPRCSCHRHVFDIGDNPHVVAYSWRAAVTDARLMWLGQRLNPRATDLSSSFSPRHPKIFKHVWVYQHYTVSSIHCATTRFENGDQPIRARQSRSQWADDVVPHHPECIE